MSTKKDVYYFLHGSRARRNSQLIKLRIKHGAKGIGVYWGLIELCCNSSHSLNIDIDGLAKELGCDESTLRSVIYDFGLFEINQDLAIPLQIGFKWAGRIKYLLPDRRNRLASLNYSAWLKIRNQVFRRDNYTCAYCGKRGGILEVDHIVPFSKGGAETIDNLATACRLCNRKKRDKNIDDFKNERG